MSHISLRIRRQLFVAGVATLAVGATAVQATKVAYEGFVNPTITVADATVPAPDGTGLDLIGATGQGFTGNWILTNGAVGGSAYVEAGLDYPATYPGTNVAMGGSAVNIGTAGNSFLRLDLGNLAYKALSVSDDIYISFLAQRTGKTVTEDNLHAEDDGGHEGWRSQNNLASEYPRNFGARLMNGPSGNGSAGTIGKPSDWNSNGVTYGDPAPLLVDTWGVGSFNDTHRLYTGADFADGVDHLVIAIVDKTHFTLYVNPTMTGADGMVSWDWTDDGDPRTLDLYGFGVEAGSPSGERPYGQWEFDEIVIGTTFESAAGFEEPMLMTWAGFVTGDYFVDTGADKLGVVYVEYAPWIYVFDDEQWLYLNEENLTSNGAWAYIKF